MTTPNAQPASVEHTATITLGRTEVPVEITLWGVGALAEADRNGYSKPVSVGRVSSVGYWGADKTHHTVNGVPVRFDATVERVQGGSLRVAHMSAYRGDKGYGLAEVTATVRSALWSALPAVVEALLADPTVAFDAEVARAERAVQSAQRDHDKALDAAQESAKALAEAERALDALKGAGVPA